MSKKEVKIIIKKLKSLFTNRDEKFKDSVILSGSNLTITFAGGNCLGDSDIRSTGDNNLLRRLKWNPSSFFKGVRSLVKDSDYLIINLGTVLEYKPSVRPFEGKKYIKWNNPRRTIKALKKINLTAVTLANNHIMDFGSEVCSKL